MERESERERVISLRISGEREYEDDYDDQFDEPGLLSLGQSIPSKTYFGRLDHIQDEMRDMKLVNQLIKEEEDERAYWEKMKNTNKAPAKALMSGDLLFLLFFSYYYLLY